MKNNFREELLKELNQKGTSQKEAEELLQIAFKLNNLSAIRRSYEFKKAQVRKITSIEANNSFFIVRVYRELLSFKLLDSLTFARRINKRVLIPVLAAIIFLLGTSSVVLAQKSLPGEALYPVKRVTEDVIITFNPVFKEEVFKRRVEENKIIIEKKKVIDEKHQLEEDRKGEDKEDKSEDKNSVNSTEEIKNSSESSKEGVEKNKKDEEKRIDRNEENEVKNSEVKGAEDKRIELNEEGKKNRLKLKIPVLRLIF